MLHTIRSTIVFLILLFLFQGCTGVLKTTWRDFNAYFNTYFNAKTSFERGVELQTQQRSTINPERPIRIHITPHRAGQSDFEKAMQKSADVIRFHPGSRWVDNSIMMIGQSYFYQQQYFSADQKFLELLGTTSDPELRQRAIFWRGRAALELENYIEGVNYIQSRLFSTEFEWDPRIEAELRLVIAELLVARGEYEEAVVYISEALPDIQSRRIEMRATFLLGQLLEMLGRYDEAFTAYDRATHQSNPSYDLIYYAELKLGIVARKRGENEWAYDHFVSMSRDDRHFEYISSIEYEIGRTLQEMSSYTRARQRYEQTLRRRSQAPRREIQAKIFYGMAEIYRDFYLDFSLTAAYFDSSAQQATSIELLPENFDAAMMSRSYGEYSRLKNEVHRLDSLLWLGELSDVEFDSVIAVVRQQRIEEIREQERAMRRQQLVNLSDTDMGVQADEATENGFLNHNNPQLMQQNRQAFQAYWGARPLVDGWRRMEAVRINIVRQFEEQGEDISDIDKAIEQAVAPQEQMVEIDLSDIPFTEEQQFETRRMIASHEYEIGNVFFMSLAMPDSAALYYRSVMRRFSDSELAPQAIYSLSELYQAAGDSSQAILYAMQLVDFYPATIFADRMADRYNLDHQRAEFVMTRQDSILARYNEILSLSKSENRAGMLRRFAKKYPDEPQASEALYRSVLDFIGEARDDELYALRLGELTMTRYFWEQEKKEFEIFQDSVKALLADSVYLAATVKIDSLMLESMPEEPSQAESMPEEPSQEESMPEEPLQEESMPEEPLQEESMPEEPLQEESMQGEGGSGFLADESDSVAAVITTIDDQGIFADEEDSLLDLQHIVEDTVHIDAETAADSVEMRESMRPDREAVTDSDRLEERHQFNAETAADSVEMRESMQPDREAVTDSDRLEERHQFNAEITADSVEMRESMRPDREAVTDSDRLEERHQFNEETAADSVEPEEFQQAGGDTTVKEVRKPFQTHLQELVNKSHPEPDFSDLFPYEGALWDSARVVLITLRSEYPDFPRRNVVEALSDELDVDRVRALLVDTDKIYECGELDDRPEIQGGLDGFLDQSDFRNVIGEHQISGEVAIQVLIGKEGKPMEISTEEEDDGLGIMESLLKAVEEHMRFSIPQYTGVDVQARCEYSIEFNYSESN